MRLAASQELPVGYGGAGAVPHLDVWLKPSRGFIDSGMIPGKVVRERY